MEKREPRMRRDKLCALARCRKPLLALAIKHADPFHSTLCCRAHYGVRFKSDENAKTYSTKPNRAVKAAHEAATASRRRARREVVAA